MRFKRVRNLVLEDDDDLEKHDVRKEQNEREISMSSGEQTLEDDNGVDVRERKLDDTDDLDETHQAYQPPYWIVLKDEIDDQLKVVEEKCK